MEHAIKHGPVFSTLHVTLNTGETVIGEKGAMISMTPSVELKAKTAGKGIFGAAKAMIGGEALFSTTFTAQENNSEVVLAPSSPGDIIHFSLNGQKILAQGGTYLAGTEGLELGTQGSLRGALMGEGLFLQTISGTGDVWLSSYGAVYVKELGEGEEYSVDNGNMVAFESSVSFTIKKATKGLFSTFASGEGFVSRFKGPGKVWIQTRSITGLAALLMPYIQKKN
jgi:uncharacterized protein (TIGR00266 family)